MFVPSVGFIPIPGEKQPSRHRKLSDAELCSSCAIHRIHGTKGGRRGRDAMTTKESTEVACTTLMGGSQDREGRPRWKGAATAPGAGVIR